MKYYQFYTTAPKFKHEAYEFNDLNGIDEYIKQNKHQDTYKSINLYKEPTDRIKDNVGVLIALVLDIEAQNHAFDITFSQAKQMIEYLKHEFNVSMPAPSKINHSGRGLHMYFDIEPSQDIEKYMLVLNYLQKSIDEIVGKYDALSQVTHDPKVNYWSLIRVEGTKNTKANAYVSTIYYNLKQYTLDELIKGYIKPLEALVGASRQEVEQEYIKHFKPFKRHFKGYNKSYTKETLREAILQDLINLQQMRNDHIIMVNGAYKYEGNEGNRNFLLFYYGLYAKYHYKDTKKLYEAMSAFNDNFKPQPLTKRELEATYKSILSNNYATPRTATIIKNVGVDNHEMQHMSVIFDAEEKRKRNVKKVGKHKQAKSKQRAEQKQNDIQHMKILRAQGLTHKQIATIYNLSERTIFRYLKAYDKNG